MSRSLLIPLRGRLALLSVLAVTPLLIAIFTGCGDADDGGELGASVSTTTAELVNYDMTTAQYFDLSSAEQRKVIDSLLVQEETECEGELPGTFTADVAARAFAAPRGAPLAEAVLQLCSEGYGTLAG